MTALMVLTSFVGVARAQEGVTLLRDAEIETFIRREMIPIWNAAGIDPDAVTIYLVDDPTMNAFVSGGQNIFINTGLIAAAEKPNEIVGVLAHETGHMAGGHLLRSSDAEAGALIPSIIGMVIGIGAMATGSPNAGSAILAGSETIAQQNVLAFTRTQEASADQAAVRFLTKAGESGKGLLTFFQRFRNEEAMSPYDIDPFLQDHPVSAERMALLEQEVTSSPYYDKEDPPQDVAAFDLIRAKIHGFLDRADAGFRRYPASDTSAPARYARAVLYFRQGSIDSALGQINSLISEQPKNPYFQELKGQILYESGRVDDAVAPYAEAVKLDPGQPLILTGYGQALVASSESKGGPALDDQAITELKKAVATEPDILMAWQTLGEAYSNQGKEGMAELATAEMYYNAGNLRPAVEFAMRARTKLDRGTAAYNRATDIIQVARTSMPSRDAE